MLRYQESSQQTEHSTKREYYTRVPPSPHTWRFSKCLCSKVDRLSKQVALAGPLSCTSATFVSSIRKGQIWTDSDNRSSRLKTFPNRGRGDRSKAAQLDSTQTANTYEGLYGGSMLCPTVNARTDIPSQHHAPGFVQHKVSYVSKRSNCWKYWTSEASSHIKLGSSETGCEPLGVSKGTWSDTAVSTSLWRTILVAQSLIGEDGESWALAGQVHTSRQARHPRQT